MKIQLIIIISLSTVIANSMDISIESKGKVTYFDLLKNALDQTNEIKAKNLSQHQGLFVSMGIGFVSGNINIKNEGSLLKSQISGNGLGIDFKMGVALNKNLILHGSYISQSLNNVLGTINYAMSGAPYFSKARESMYGIGFSYYNSKSPTFLSWTVGSGKFAFLSENKTNTITTKNGFSMQLKTGLSWWISQQVGFALAVEYVRTNSTNQTIEKLNSNRFGLVLNLSLN